MGRRSAPLVGNGSGPVQPDLRQVLYYVDPMHPAYTSDRPGIAPDCGMQLVPVYSGGTAERGTLTIDAQQQQWIGLRTEAAAANSGSAPLRVLGRVAADESHVYSLNSGVDGWIRQTMHDDVGTRVHRDDTLATFYSPEFVALEQGYLVATERMAGGVRQQAAPGTQSTAARLRDYGMGEKQIAAIAATRQMPETVDITAPADGVIEARNVHAGQRFQKNAELYRIADLAHVWINADVVDQEARLFKPGQTVVVRLPGQDGRVLHARVAQALAQSEGDSGTTRVRLEAPNPGLILRPGMTVDIELEAHGPAGVSVPAEAVLDRGSFQRVYVDLGRGRFDPRKVTTGERTGGRVAILSGLATGEKVVVEGNFLLDADSRLTDTSLAGNPAPRAALAGPGSRP